MEVVETNLKQIAQAIFSKPPGPPKSIQLELEEESCETNGNLSKTISDIILFLTINGIEILFGHRNLELLSYNDFLLLKKYINSYGFEPIITGNDAPFTPWYLIEQNIPVTRINIAFKYI